jgi:hypothetical protein
MSTHDHYAPTRDEARALASTATPLPRAVGTASLVLAAIGGVVFVAGAIVAPDRAWRAFHANWLFWSALSSGGVTFVAVQRITTARWSRAIVRFLEGYVAFLPIALVLLLLTLSLGAGHVFPWMVESYPVPEKGLYFGRGFLTARVVAVFALITALSLWYIYTSVRLDVGQTTEDGAAWAAGLRARMRRGWRDERREIHSTHSLQGKLAVLLALLYGYGWSVLSWDLSMGLSLHFQSTLYSWWFFMGAWLSALALFTLLTLAWRRYLDPAHRLITESHFHDLGKLVFAFTAFWGYLTFGQYLVIWYGNLGEETHWPRLRLIAPWEPVTLTAVTLVFVLPFFGLMSRAAKLFKPTLVLFCSASVVGIWLVRYLEVYPSRYGQVAALPFGVWEVGVAMLYLGLWGLSYVAFMNAFPRVRVTLLTSPFRDEVQVPVDPETMEPLPAHE